jgi:GTP-binding protein
MGNPLVAIVGRPNVGKSSLFNRLLDSPIAVVSELAGTTRDRISAETILGGHPMVLVDTGGLEPFPGSPLEEQVQAQVKIAIQDADCIVFVTDVLNGYTPTDAEIAQRLRRAEKPVVVVVNKVDNNRRAQGVVEFFQLGLDDPIPISAYHGGGIDELVSALQKALPKQDEPIAPQEEKVSLAIVGRTNVGKSAFLNAILGHDRAIVSSQPGTTRDALDTPLMYNEKQLMLIDTAGIRRRGKVAPGIEKYSVLRSLRAIYRADVAFVLLDATELVAAQDIHIAGQVSDTYTGAVVLVNKWDQAPELGLDQADVLEQVRSRLKFMPYAPIRFISAIQKRGIDEAINAALMVYEERKKRITQKQLRSTVMAAMAEHPPPGKGKRFLRLRRVVQQEVNPPTFTFYVNDPKLVHFSYRRYLENQLRDSLGYRWSHLKLLFKGSQGS